MIYLFIIFSGIIFGFLLSIVWDFFEKRYLLQKTKTEGDHILQESQEKSEIILDKIKMDCESKKQTAFKKFEKEQEEYRKKIQTIQSQVDKKLYQFKFLSKDYDKNKSIVDKQFSILQKQKKTIEKEKHHTQKDFEDKKSKWIKKIMDHFSFDEQQLKRELKKSLEESWTEEIVEEIEKREKNSKQNLQKNALFYLHLALNRFERPHCSKRSIEPVVFKNLKLLEKVVGPDQKHIKELEKECGVDMIVNKEDLMVQIFGIDPVRRELGRLSLKNLLKQRHINSNTIKDQTKQLKKELFKTIRKDGYNICKNLKIKNASQEVQNMMGALKYRYSFAQNQYYHCEEVGWLCGLMSSELGLDINHGKRAGMFHDIGKAFDHSVEGSHAILGADFLRKHSEKQNIVHAVRAHHHDETPSTPLAYLVISSDAVSGSRPGARRFTEDSYSKKLANLERIIDSFENIEDAYIMSSGREMRVIVNNKKIDDRKALDLSKQIARKIEKECSYPGLIKVTVVRHSEVVSIAK